MLTHPTLDKLHTLKCTGMATALTEQMTLSDIDTLSFEERLGLLVDREITERTTDACPTDCGAPASNTRPPSRTSIITTHADWIKP